MVRNYIRKTSRAETPREMVQRGVNQIIFSGRSIRSVAAEIGMNNTTLGRYVRQALVMGSRDLNVGYCSSQRVFSIEQEHILQEYLVRAANIYFGLSPKAVRELAYELAVEFGVKMPDKWSRDKCAGPDWFSGFMKRNPTLSIRTPEATSLSRATSFNRSNVERFFGQLQTVIERDQIKPYDIWNVDETGITTVQKPSSVVGPKGVKQIGALTSGERGSLVTMCAAVSATGNSVPPMFVFPRVKFFDHFIRDGPTGCIGASHPSGWMTSENFYKFIQHFAKVAKPSKEQKVLLLLDNHHSHIGLDTIKFARDNGIVMLSFPPHCSHKLQPLDRSVFGPFKKFISVEQDSWMRRNPAKTMSIYDLPGIVRDTWPRAATQANIINGFKVSGIHPLNSNIFQDTDFAPAFVTDRPDYSNVHVPSDENNDHVVSRCDDFCTVSGQKDTSTQPSDSREAVLLCENDQHVLDTGSTSDSPLQYLNAKIKDMNREIVTVPGDGHCLLHAVAVSLKSEGIQDITTEELCTLLVTEMTDYANYYSQFSNGRDIIKDIDRYIRYKEFDNDTIDLVLSAICNCLGVSAIIYQESQTGDNIVAVGPSRPDVVFRGDFYLVLIGRGGNAHYSGVKKLDAADDNPIIQDTTETFAPEKIRPFPKAPARKTKGVQRKRKSAVLTDTPEKNALELEVKRKQQSSKLSLKKSKSKKNLFKKKKITQKKRKNNCKPSMHESSSDEEDWFCLVCMEPYSNSRAREVWIQCQSCKYWSHKECTNVPKNNVYICHNCESDEEVNM